MAEQANDGYYTEEGHPLKCACCEGVDIADEVVDSIDVGVGGGGIPCEISYHCQDCDTVIGYWSYGYYDAQFQHPPIAKSTETTRKVAP